MIFFVMIVFLLTGANFVRAGEGDLCEIDTKTADWSSWEKCDGKPVRLTGRISESGQQHPSGLHDTLYERRYEQAVDVGNTQIVLTSREPISCMECVSFDGIVDLVDLGGRPGVRGSYKNVWIKVSNYDCRLCGSE